MINKLEILRQSGTPVRNKDQAAYDAEWKETFDIIMERSERAVTKRPLKRLPAMLVAERMSAIMERRLFIKHNKKVKVQLPQTELAWTKLIKKYKAPVLAAQKQEGGALILIIMDILQA